MATNNNTKIYSLAALREIRPLHGSMAGKITDNTHTKKVSVSRHFHICLHYACYLFLYAFSAVRYSAQLKDQKLIGLADWLIKSSVGGRRRRRRNLERAKESFSDVAHKFHSLRVRSGKPTIFFSLFVSCFLYLLPY